VEEGNSGARFLLIAFIKIVLRPRSKATLEDVEFVKPAASSMLDLLPPVYLVALGLGVAAVFVVLFYSFTSNSNYESQMRRQQLAERRAKQAASEAQSSGDN
jgi:phosphotransferase system  glucose/maltose/N-acetylglucosamine-specific IIC component